MSEFGDKQLSTEVKIPEKSIEYDLPEMNLPHGKIDPETKMFSQPSEKQLKEFFTTQTISRLVYCPYINVDSTDSWGIFGNEPGYFFIESSNYKGAKCLNDKGMLIGEIFENLTTKNSFNISKVKHYDFFPHSKFEYSEITRNKNPNTFVFLRKLLDGVDKDDLSTYSPEDLYSMELELRKVHSSEFDKVKIVQENPETYKGHEYQQGVKKILKKLPEYVLKRLEVLSIMQKRNLSLDNSSKSFKKEEKIVLESIEQAKQANNPDLAKKISTTFEKLSPFLKNNPHKELDSPSLVDE